MKLIVFSDLHYFAGDIETAIFNRSKKLVRYALPFLDSMINTANSDDEVAACINLGDTIQDNQSREDDLQALRYIFGKLKEFSVPCYSLLGNHDLKMMNSREEVEQVLGYKSTFSLDLCGYHLVFLSTEVRCELGTDRGGCYKAQYMSDADLAWLREDLKNNTLPVLIFTHYPLAEDESVTDPCMFMKNRADVKSIIKEDKNVRAVISGHQHRTRTLTEDGIDYHLIGSPISCQKTPGIPDAVYLTVDITEDIPKFSVNTMPLDEIPG